MFIRRLIGLSFIGILLFTTLGFSSTGISRAQDERGMERYAAQFTGEVGAAMVKIAQRGRTNGLHLNVFSTAGDCHVADNWFIQFYKDGRSYNLGNYHWLQTVLDYYTEGSFLNRSWAHEGGFTSAAILDPTWADPKACVADESPILCEIRVHRPAVIIIEVGVIDLAIGTPPERFESSLNRIIDAALDAGVIPMLATMPQRPRYFRQAIALNDTVRSVAAGRTLPLIDLAAAIDALPNHGVATDNLHLSPGNAFISADFRYMEDGFTIWNFLVLQSLYNTIPILNWSQAESVQN
ncbi:MAG: SGNH/GDSL hydrolase family protein [Anaerolineales bacterium]|nr:SGNH/GDSL hydrolase family protein [Anaerolineales bacterium]